MALTVQKLENGFDPERPLLIWAIGSSFTLGLGDGDLLTKLIRKQFPKAPKIVYKALGGGATSYHFSHGWARQRVIPEQPDVVLIYNFGTPKDLEEMIVELRTFTTADILVGSLHWCTFHKNLWPDAEAVTDHQDLPRIREICSKYGVEFVENRREMTTYMLANGLRMDDLLTDGVHQSKYGAQMAVMNIARHFHWADSFAYDPATRERRVEVEKPAEDVRRGADRWTAAEGGGALVATQQGSDVSVAFTGNRIELIGWRRPGGGTARVLIDGKPADETAVFHAGWIQADPKNANPPDLAWDRGPHAVTLGDGLVPQRWTITLTDDSGDYALVGSETGADGSGNAFKPFTSSSGQVTIDPSFWRDAKNNRAGDRYTFDVVRATVGSVSFRGDAVEKFRLRLATHLPNRAHEVKLVATGDGPVTIDAFDVFTPPLGR
jgi:hypothetical protein